MRMYVCTQTCQIKALFMYVATYVSFISVAPTIISPILTQIVKSSSNVSFICTANSKPQATIQWTKNGNTLSNTTTIIISSTTMGNCALTDPPDQCEISSTLKILNTQLPDNGVYTCNASNEAGDAEENTTLIVVGKYV